jgi:hypothetical protein
MLDGATDKGDEEVILCAWCINNNVMREEFLSVFFIMKLDVCLDAIQKEMEEDGLWTSCLPVTYLVSV